jgi:hypothetical protein
MILISRKVYRSTIYFEGKVDLGEGSIKVPSVSFVVDISVGDYFLHLCDCKDWIELAQDRDRRWALVNAVMNHLVP